MTALEAVVQHTQKHDHLTLIHANHNPETIPVKPARLNLAGYCVMCFDYACEAENCIRLYEASVWEICRSCDGSGLNAKTNTVCNCESGLEDMTHSGWPNVALARPPQLNFAGWCNWCDDRWCTSQRCARFQRESEWAVCDRCNGKGFDNPTSTPCTCVHGLAHTR